MGFRRRLTVFLFHVYASHAASFKLGIKFQMKLLLSAMRYLQAPTLTHPERKSERNVCACVKKSAPVGSSSSICPYHVYATLSHSLHNYANGNGSSSSRKKLVNFICLSLSLALLPPSNVLKLPLSSVTLRIRHVLPA